MSKLNKKMKERYGISHFGRFMVCEDRHTQRPNSQYTQSDSIVFKWGVIPPNDVFDRHIMVGSKDDVKSTLDLELDKIESLSEIYSQTKSGWNSDFHPINKNYRKKMDKLKEEYRDKPKDEEWMNDKYELHSTEYTELIPIVLINRKDGRNLSKEELENDHLGEVSEDGTICLSFRVDNPMIREMFYDGHILNTNNDGEGITKEHLEKMNYRLKEHNEYLDYFFSQKGWTWIKLWFEKCDNGHKELLHSEYLEQVLNKTLEEYHNEEQDRINSEMKEKGLDVNNIKTNDELVELDEIIRNGDE